MLNLQQGDVNLSFSKLLGNPGSLSFRTMVLPLLRQPFQTSLYHLSVPAPIRPRLPHTDAPAS